MTAATCSSAVEAASRADGGVLRFRVRCVPPTATAQQKGAFVLGGKVRFFVKARVRRTEDFLAGLLSPHVPPRPFDRAVSVRIAWTFPYRSSERKSVVRSGADVPHDRRPDLDNLGKSLLDVMTRLGFWTDDGRISRLEMAKSWGAEPGIAVEIRGEPSLPPGVGTSALAADDDPTRGGRV